MQNRFLKIITSFFFLSLVQIGSGYAQVNVSGPGCVMPGTEYQYEIMKDQSDSSNIQVCLSGGVIAGTDSVCRNALFFTFIRVIWRDSSRGKITLRTSRGNDSIIVKVTKILRGGKINAPMNFQMLRADSVPGILSCSDAVGGGCSPIYKYEWQKSADGMDWKILSGATSQNLEFASPISQNTYYRRKVTETNSGSESFSDVAVIILNTEQ